MKSLLHLLAFVLMLSAVVGYGGAARATLILAGDILVADASAFDGSGGVIRVDPITGAQTTVSSGGSLVAPFDIVVAPTPPPAALPLYGTGLAVLGFLGWRRRKAA